MQSKAWNCDRWAVIVVNDRSTVDVDVAVNNDVVVVNGRLRNDGFDRALS